MAQDQAITKPSDDQLNSIYEPPDADEQKTPEAREARLRHAAAMAMDVEFRL